MKTAPSLALVKDFHLMFCCEKWGSHFTVFLNFQQTSVYDIIFFISTLLSIDVDASFVFYLFLVPTNV